MSSSFAMLADIPVVAGLAAFTYSSNHMLLLLCHLILINPHGI